MKLIQVIQTFFFGRWGMLWPLCTTNCTYKTHKELIFKKSKQKNVMSYTFGTYDSQRSIVWIPSKSFGATSWETPLLCMIWTPPNCELLLYTSRPSSCEGKYILSLQITEECRETWKLHLNLFTILNMVMSVNGVTNCWW